MLSCLCYERENSQNSMQENPDNEKYFIHKFDQ